MQFCDLKTQYHLLKEKINSSMAKVLEHGQFINGPEIEELEKKCATFIGVENAIGVSSGTDALLLALMAYDVSPGDYILTTPMTFVSTAEVISLLKATPVFIDIDETTFNINPQKISEFLEKTKIQHNKIKGIIAVNLFGKCADYDEIQKIADEYNLFVIEDGAQSFGSTYKNRKSLSLADISTTSFFPAKPLGCYGDGGMIFTNDNQKAHKMKVLRNHGQVKRFQYEVTGLNARLDTLQAAILLAKFDVFADEEITKRQLIAKKYQEGLTGLPIQLQLMDDDDKSIWAQFSFLCENQKELQAYLTTQNIPSVVYYPYALHTQDSFSNCIKTKCTKAEMVSKKILSLPMSAYLLESDQQKIISAVRSFFKKNKL